MNGEETADETDGEANEGDSSGAGEGSETAGVRTNADGYVVADKPSELIDRRGCRSRLLWVAFAVVIGLGGAALTFTLTGDSDDNQDQTESAVNDAVPDSNDDSTAVTGDDPVEDVVDESDDETTDTIGDGNESAANEPDPSAQPETYRVMLDDDGQAWLHVKFRGEWHKVTLEEWHSFFVLFAITLNPTVEVGWERHDGAETILGTPSEAYILEDGTAVFATGLFPVAPYDLSIAARFGSWLDKDGPPANFGEDSIAINSDTAETGNPLTDLGGPPVFDLVAGS